ncbi:MAG TPA: helix-turn-helix domain-containing protein [Waddliaceae bacterium]
MTSHTDIGAMVAFHRKQGKLSRKELARLSGVGKTVIYDIEHGKLTIQLATLLKVFHVLNIRLTFESPLMSLFKDEKS